jgi:hypothetical protein
VGNILVYGIAGNIETFGFKGIIELVEAYQRRNIGVAELDQPLKEKGI